MKELIDLYKLIYVDTTETRIVDRQKVFAFNAELALSGYSLTERAISVLQATSDESFMNIRSEVLSALENPSYTDRTLFSKFPYETPDQWAYLNKRILSHQHNDELLRRNNVTILSCGHAIHDALFDLNDFGACPVCQENVPELTGKSSKLLDFESVTPLKPLGVVTEQGVSKIVRGLLSRNSSLSPAEKALILKYGKTEDFDVDEVFKETLPFLFVHSADPMSVQKHISGLSDILRIASYVSNESADLSLKDNTKFKLSTARKKQILRLMENSINDQSNEDLMRYRERWLKLGKLLAIGSEENRRKYPKTFAAFDTLRNDPKSIDTYNRFAERLVRAKVKKASKGALADALAGLAAPVDGFTTADLERLATRPAEFARRLDFLLRNVENGSEILNLFGKSVVKKITKKMLFELISAFRYRMKNLGVPLNRAFFPKGNTNNVKVIPDRRTSINSNLSSDLFKAIDIMSEELFNRNQAETPLGKVFIDGALDDVLVPFNRRGDSDVSDKMLKGSRYHFDHSGIIRAFLFWNDPSDVDLSVVCYDEHFVQTEQVSFRNLSGSGMVHSGDITNGQGGAAEYIDIDVSKLKKNVRYVAMMVYLYSYNGGGDRAKAFENFECYAGVMRRDKLASGEKFEPASVEFKFNVNARKTQAMPVLIDVREDKIIYLDMAVGNNYGACVEGENMTDLIRVFADMKVSKPTLKDVLTVTASARGEIVDNREDADVIYDLTTDIDTILSDCGI
jgi:hypothetical protein